MDKKGTCPICKKKLVEQSELQDKICRMITIKQFANNSPGFLYSLILTYSIGTRLF